MKITALAVLVLLADARATVSFPGPQREFASPDGAVTVIWWEPDVTNTGHSLLLRAHPEDPHAKSWRIHSFPRSVTVSWAPKGHVLVVTDSLSNETSTTFAYNADRGTSFDVCDAPQRQIGDAWTRADQHYCEQAGWTADGQLQLRLWGRGPGGEFDRQVVAPRLQAAAVVP
jgi:hypothetical protein